MPLFLIPAITLATLHFLCGWWRWILSSSVGLHLKYNCAQVSARARLASAMRPREIRARCLAAYTRREIRDNSCNLAGQRDEVFKIGTVPLNAGRLTRMCVSTLICRLTHWIHKREIPTDSLQHGNDFKKGDFRKNVSFKSWRNLLTSSSSGVLSLFSHDISFYASFEAYNYVFTAQTTGLWKTACDSSAQTGERRRYTDHEY